MQRKFESRGCVFNEQWFDDCGSETDGPGKDHLLMYPILAPDGSYIGDAKVGGNFIRLLARKGIYAPERASPGDNVASIGKSEKDGKWYGWSHRAMHGFEIGSSVKMGDCAFTPSNREEAAEDALRFWGDNEEYHKDSWVGDDEHRDPDGEGPEGCRVHWTYTDDVPNKKLRGTTSSMFCEYPDEWGRGEWTAKTEEDAKQMAIDFANDVS
jgi:hypothetical protein